MVNKASSSFNDIIRALLKGRHRKGLPLTLDVLEAGWPLLIGDYFAAHTRPRHLDPNNRVLHIGVTSKPRLHEFERRKFSLLKRMNGLLPFPLSDLTFHLERPTEAQLDAATPKPPTPPPPMLPIPPHEQALLDKIDDDGLRAVLTRMRMIARGRAEDD